MTLISKIFSLCLICFLNFKKLLLDFQNINFVSNNKILKGLDRLLKFQWCVYKLMTDSICC